MITLDNIGYRVGKSWLARGVTLDIRPGTFCALVGPNGAGKTTLLRLMSGELAPTEGEARLRGKPVHAYPPQELARLRAYLQQKREISFPFTSLEIALFGRAPHLNGAKETAQDIQTAKEALRKVEAEPFERRLYTTLSGGESSRVDIARVLAQTPELFLLDEPANHLDLRHQTLVLSLCKKISMQGKTIVAAIHDLNLAAMFADMLVVMKEGAVVDVGPPEYALTEASLTEVYDIPFEVLQHPNGYPWVMPRVSLTETVPQPSCSGAGCVGCLIGV